MPRLNFNRRFPRFHVPPDIHPFGVFCPAGFIAGPQLSRKWAIIAWLFLAGVSISAQSVKLETLNASIGLSQGMVYSILQDHEGFLWFGTKNGLNKYTGYTCEVFQHDPFDPFSLSDNEITCLREDRLGRIWIGTNYNGLDVLDPRSNKFYHINKLASSAITAISCDPGGEIWVGTSSGLNCVRIPDVISTLGPELDHLTRIDTYFIEKTGVFDRPRDRIIDVCVQPPEGKVWVSTDNQIGFLRPQDHQFQFVVKNQYDNSKQGGNAFFTLAADGALWIGLTDDIRRILNDRIEIYPLPAHSLFPRTKIAFDASGNAYITTRKQIYRLDAGEIGHPGPNGLTLIYEFPFDGVIGTTELLIDRSGLIWFGTNGYGLRKYNPGNSKFHTYLSGKSPRRIVVDSKSRVWVWTAGSLFKLLDNDRLATERFLYRNQKLLQHDAVSDQSGRIWLLAEGTGIEQGMGYLIEIEEQTLKEISCTKLPCKVTINSRIVRDRQGMLWATGAECVLVRINPDDHRISSFDFSRITGRREVAAAIHCDPSGKLWLGMVHGLVCGTPAADSMTFQAFINDPANHQSLNCNNILCICDDPYTPETYCWLGTNGGGLNLLNKLNGKVEHFTTADGLSNNVVYGILPDDKGRLWLSTNCGLSSFDIKEKVFRNFFDVDGLQDNEFNTNSYAKDASGRLYFGGVNGLTAFYPFELAPANSSPAVYITGIRINGKKWSPGYSVPSNPNGGTTTDLELQYFENQVTIEFAAVDFAAPAQNRFKYRLIGANINWTEPSTMNAPVFSNLPPGLYRFEVVTGGIRGVWDSNTAVLQFRILPPWWKSTPAYLLYFLLASILLYSLFQFWMGRVRLNQKLKMEQEEANRLSELNRIKNDFFNNVTHEFRTPLTLLLEPVRQLKEQISDSSQVYRLELIEHSARRLLNYVNQLLDLSRLEADHMPLYHEITDPVLLLSQLVESFQPLADEKSISLTSDLPSAGLMVLLDEEKCIQIITNLLSNAFKFTNPGGEVRVRMNLVIEEKNETRIEIAVSDTGVGISEQDLPQVFNRFFQTQHQRGGTGIGLALCKELAERMGGNISVESIEGSGSTFRVNLPGVISEYAPQAYEPKTVALPLKQDARTAFPAKSSLHAHQDEPLILLVEDDIALRQFIRASLPAGFKIAEASNGEEGLEMAGTLVPDLIISDVTMPLMDGLAMTEHLKSMDSTSHIPIILLTAKTQFNAKMEGLKSGADAYLFKPFRSDEMETYIYNLLRARDRMRSYFSRADQGQPIVESVQELTNQEQGFLQKLMQIIEENLENETMDADEFAKRVFLSRSQLHRKLTALTGLSLSEFVRNYRLDKAKELLLRREMGIAEVAWRTGFANAKYFSTVFKKRFGKSPSEL